MSLHQYVQQSIKQPFYFSKSLPVPLLKGIVRFKCFDDKNKPTEAYNKLLLRFPSLFTLNRDDETICIDIRQIPDGYDFYYRKIYKKGDEDLVIRWVYCVNNKLNKWFHIGTIPYEYENTEKQDIKIKKN